MSKRKSNANDKEITTLLDAAKAADLSPEVYTEELIAQDFNPYKFKIKTPEVVADPENKRFGSQINIAKYYEQVVDPNTGRLVAKDRPTGALGKFAGTIDFLTGGLTDLDRSGGGLFGREAENISGFGKKVDAADITLPTKLREKLTQEFEPEKSALEKTDEYVESLKKIYGDPELKKLRRQARTEEAIQNQLNYMATEPIRQAFLNRAAEQAAQRGLRVRAAKEAMPSNIQNIMLSKQAQAATAASAEAERARAAADQQDAATRFAGLGMQRRFG
jgi:hypothetical protein